MTFEFGCKMWVIVRSRGRVWRELSHFKQLFSAKPPPGRWLGALVEQLLRNKNRKEN